MPKSATRRVSSAIRSGIGGNWAWSVEGLSGGSRQLPWVQRETVRQFRDAPPYREQRLLRTYIVQRLRDQRRHLPHLALAETARGYRRAAQPDTAQIGRASCR